MTEQKSSILSKAKVGAMAGLVGGFALFSSFLAIDAQLDIPNGTFYKTIGIVAGIDSSSAIAFGFLSHMGAAALIGACYSISASIWRAFRIVTVPKGILTGALTGIIVFTIFFLPIHYYVMMPSMIAEFNVIDESRLSVEELGGLYHLLLETDRVLWFSLFLHVLFGVVMGLMTGFILHEDYAKVPRIKGFL